MKRSYLVVLIVLTVVGVVAGTALAWRRLTNRPTVLRAVVASETAGLLADPVVVGRLRKLGYTLRTDPRGSREMATIDLSRYDLALPSSAAAAAAVAGRRAPAGRPRSPFSSPLAIATFTPVVDLLATVGLTRRAASGYWVLDMPAYLDAASRHLRWDQIPGNLVYPYRRDVLVATTRPADSNSAALYAAIAGALLRDDPAKVAALFAAQGARDSTSEEPFEAYLTRGLDFAPLVLGYEAQYAGRAAAHDPALTRDRVLAYPSPTLLSEHTTVPFTAAGNRLAGLLGTDPVLQDRAAAHGFRTLDPARSAAVLAGVRSGDAALPTTVSDLLPPPSAPALARLLTAVEEILT